MSHAFVSTFKSTPGDALRHLFELTYLELNNNHFQHLRESTFNYKTKLRTIKLQDCMIDTLKKGTFQVNIYKTTYFYIILYY